jgi:hypothetical protein
MIVESCDDNALFDTGSQMDIVSKLWFDKFQSLSMMHIVSYNGRAVSVKFWNGDIVPVDDDKAKFIVCFVYEW